MGKSLACCEHGMGKVPGLREGMEQRRLQHGPRRRQASAGDWPGRNGFLRQRTFFN